MHPLAAILDTLTLCCMQYRFAKKSREKKNHPTSKVYLRYVQYFICMMAGVMAAGFFSAKVEICFGTGGVFAESHRIR